MTVITRSPAVAEIADRTAYDALINCHLDCAPLFAATETKRSHDQESEM